MKHAFLIIAHKNYNQLNQLISLIDNERTDIFIHIDKRSPPYSLPSCKSSSLYRINSMRTNWGGYSLVECELSLIEEALNTGCYSFLHLLSGQCMLIKPIEYILDFFEANSSFNFIHFDKPETSAKMIERVKYYYPFLEVRPKGRSVWSVMQKIIVMMEKYILRIDRTSNQNLVFKSGSQWWSIKADLAEYIVSKRTMIRSVFSNTMADEMFVQTLVYNSDFYNTLYLKEVNDMKGNQRLIDFDRGKPYIWKVNDVDTLNNSELLFARKFDEFIDNKVIDWVIQRNHQV